MHAISRRRALAQFASWLSAGGLVAATVNTDRTSAASLGRDSFDGEIEVALRKAGTALIEHQDKQGAWRSARYANFADGVALTPMVLRGIARLEETTKSASALASGLRFVDQCYSPHGLHYCVYAASTMVVLRGNRRFANAESRDRWLSLLCRHQLPSVDESSVEIAAADPASRIDAGGWSYATTPPILPRAQVTPLERSNLSATVWALEALARCRAQGDRFASSASEVALAQAKARAFLFRCQNYAENSEPSAGGNDGGFYFSPDEAARNKAGSRGDGADMAPIFRSYGSATVDGLSGLLDSGMSRTHPRVVAAQGWLASHFRVDEQPGDFAAARQSQRFSYFFYYCRGLGRLLRQWDPSAGIWPRQLAAELLRRQSSDGLWRNPAVDGREDEPLVATPLALEALDDCRWATRKAGGQSA